MLAVCAPVRTAVYRRRRAKRTVLYPPCRRTFLELACDRRQDAGGRTVTAKEMVLSRLRAENARLKRELEIIRKAAAYIAKDAL